MGEDNESRRCASRLRSIGINTEIELRSVRMKKSLKWASALGIPFVAIIGEDEVTGNCIALKDLDTGIQESLSIDEVLAKVEHWRTEKTQTGS